MSDSLDFGESRPLPKATPAPATPPAGQRRAVLRPNYNGVNGWWVEEFRPDTPQGPAWVVLYPHMMDAVDAGLLAYGTDRITTLERALRGLLNLLDGRTLILDEVSANVIADARVALAK